MLRTARYGWRWIALWPALCGLWGDHAPSFAQAPSARLVNTAKLAFEQPELRTEFERYDAVARRFAHDRFEYEPYSMYGNFVQAHWTKGPKRPRYGHIEFADGMPPAEDIHRITVQTLVVPPELQAGNSEKPMKLPRANNAAIGVTFVARDPDRWCVGWPDRRGTGGHEIELGPQFLSVGSGETEDRTVSPP
jgi:hypothetical protein